MDVIENNFYILMEENGFKSQHMWCVFSLVSLSSARYISIIRFYNSGLSIGLIYRQDIKRSF